MNASKQLEDSEVRALSMIVVGRCTAESDVEAVARSVLTQYLKSVEVFEAYNHEIADKKYESGGIVSRK